MIGASIYFSNLNTEYVEKILSIGVEALFTTVVMPEEDYDEDFYRKLDYLKKITKNNDVEMITDVSEILYDKLKIDSIFELKAMGFSGVRLDSGFQDVDTVKELTNHFQVYLNGSHVTEKQLDLYKENGICMDKISIMHNFYPKRFSGLDNELFNEVNQSFLKHNVRIIAFVAGDTELRGPEYIGLPTLESHRGIPPYVAYLDLMSRNQIDDVFVGDPGVNYLDLEMMVEHSKNGVVSVPCQFEKEIGISKVNYFVRDDYSKELFRISIKDLKVLNETNSKVLNRKKGMITVDNHYSGRYHGELNLCRTDLPIDKGVSIIGEIKPLYIDILDYFKRGSSIKFIS